MLQKVTTSSPEVPRRTLVICNTVGVRKQFTRLFVMLSTGTTQLTWSYFTRVSVQRSALDNKIGWRPHRTPEPAEIVVATQVIEAGLDLSAAILWTEVARSQASCRRLGRLLNRYGEFGHDGQSKSTDGCRSPFSSASPLPTPSPKATKDETEKDTTRAYLPYDRGECRRCRPLALQSVADVSPGNLETRLRKELDRALQAQAYSLQSHELLDFFDTDSNLSLGYTDVFTVGSGHRSRNRHLYSMAGVAGRFTAFEFDVGRREICQVPLRQVVGKNGLSTWHQGLVWQGTDRGWQPASRDNLLPGATLLLPVTSWV